MPNCYRCLVEIKLKSLLAGNLKVKTTVLEKIENTSNKNKSRATHGFIVHSCVSGSIDSGRVHLPSTWLPCLQRYFKNNTKSFPPKKVMLIVDIPNIVRLSKQLSILFIPSKSSINMGKKLSPTEIRGGKKIRSYK